MRAMAWNLNGTGRCLGEPMGRPAQPEEIAPAYVLFASNADSGYVTGHVLPQLGGDTGQV